MRAITYMPSCFASHAPRIDNAISNLREALKGSDAEVIKSRTEELRQASYQLSELLYRQAAGQAGGEAPETAGAGAEAGGASQASDDVIDAEFKPQ